MSKQLERVFCIENKDKQQIYEITNVNSYPVEEKIHIDVNGLHCCDEGIETLLEKYFKKHFKDTNISTVYTQIKKINVLLAQQQLFKSCILNCIGKQHLALVNSIVFTLSGNKLNVKTPANTPPILEKSVCDVIKTLLCEMDVELNFIKEVKAKSVASESPRNPRATKKSEGFLFGRDEKAPDTEILDVNGDSGVVTVKGYVTHFELRDLKDGVSQYLNINITDYESSISCGRYFKNAKTRKTPYTFKEDIKKGMYIQIQGDSVYDKYKGEQIIQIRSIAELKKKEMTDDEEEKRVELHLHSKMSSLDGLVDIKQLMATASSYGHKAVAVTDHGAVQSFPDAASAAGRCGVKVLYGVEAYMFDDSAKALTGESDMDLSGSFVVFDVETTGLDYRTNKIIEIGAVKIENGEIVDTFSAFINPQRALPQKIIDLTGISDNMVKNAPTEDIVLPKFLDFAKGSVLVAHNAEFDMSFAYSTAKRCNIGVQNAYMDTIQIAKRLMPTTRSFKLDRLCKHFKIELRSHHRAKDDAKATGELLLKLFEMLKEKDIKNIGEIDNIKNMNIQAYNVFHTIIFAKNKVGLKNLYKLVSISNLKYLFRGKPNIPKSEIINLREGLLIGSACEAGELFRAITRHRPEGEIEKIASFYDYLEVQPLGNNMFMVDKGDVASIDDLIAFNKKVIDLGEKMDKLVVATGDVHFMKNRDSIFRAILMHSKKFEDADKQAPLYYRTTKEMLNEFYYLDEEKAREIVITNTNKINDMIEAIDPLPEEKLYAPTMPNAEEQIIEMSYKTAKEIYGENLPDAVEKRLKKELSSITGYGYSVLYLIAHKLVKKSNDDGYLVGSRGSVGSSFVATMTGITEVNPLSPHYTCKNCFYSDFDVDAREYGCGPDLPDKKCPECGTELDKRGYDIPFEVFLGFKGDKVPDIDLNFSGEYQGKAHKYTEVLFGKDNVFRAGTISGVADKTAYGYVMNYLQDKELSATKAEVSRLVEGCVGVRRTTGQHPGGIIVVPHEYDIYDFTPIQYPADDKNCGVITTHFDFNSLHDRLVKLDILGHDDPTVLKMLFELTGLNPVDIPLDDKETMSLFSGPEALGITKDDIMAEMGTYGIPEFGTGFVRGMLKDTLPTTMSELVRISGLSHGTDVWLGNAQVLVKEGTATLKEAICTRDDIMNALMAWDVKAKMSFDIMERVRKGRGLTDEMEDAMVDANVPDWFINSCKLIKYMFPKAHAVAYVTMGFRVAYYKVNYPIDYYTAYFSVRGNDFDALSMLCTKEEVVNAVKALRAQGNDISTKDKGKLIIWEIVLEMRCRGFEFAPLDLYKAEASTFIIVDGKIMPPLDRLPGLGTVAAKTIIDAREDGKFNTIKEFSERTSANKSVIAVLQEIGCLDGVPETSQVSIFDML